MAKKCESNDICSGMLDLLVSRGVVEDKRIINPKVRMDKQKRNQMAYHNTELLLKHYRDIVWLLECFPDTIAEELEEPMKDVDELIDKLDLEMAKGNKSDKNYVINEAVIRENQFQSKKNWFITKSQLERESNLYCCLSLQSKLNLMGLRYCKVDENDLPALTEAEYLNIYAEDDMPDTQSYGLDVDGKKVVKYTLNFPDSKRKNLAILEHFRWNSFMISQGMIPASKEQILNEKVERNGKLKHTNGKNYGLRRHGNLTTFDGLVTFRQMIAKRDGGDEADYDVIKYDYQLLDDAYWLLKNCGYKIVKL